MIRSFPTGFRRVFTRFVLYLLFLLLTYCARRIYWNEWR
jgi:hypothetical protein